jgi:NAD(P)-dependent dehydrogenase (short-subunit alcohol dehydrogenase family)
MNGTVLSPGSQCILTASDMVKGKLAVVTGGANGIGWAAARLLAANGASVCIFDREKAGEEIGARWFEMDVTSRQSIDAAFAAAGTPDIVIANAGVAEEEPFLEHSVERWERVLSINLTGAFHTVQAAARLMKTRRSGAIVLTASTNSYDGESRLTAYNASKAGLLGLVHTAANELGPYQIRVNAVCPGLIRTRLTERHFSSPEILRDYFRQIPLGRGGSPEEVAQAIVFLASDMASYITGATLFVDGGQMASKFGTWSEETAEFREGQWKLREGQ